MVGNARAQQTKMSSSQTAQCRSILDDEPLLPKRVVVSRCRPEEAGDSNKLAIGQALPRAGGPSLTSICMSNSPLNHAKKELYTPRESSPALCPGNQNFGPAPRHALTIVQTRRARI